jgi:hypothetical protein
MGSPGEKAEEKAADPGHPRRITYEMGIYRQQSGAWAAKHAHFI